MSSLNPAALLVYLDPLVCGLVLLSMGRAKSLRTFSSLSFLLSFRLLADLAYLPFLVFAGHGIERHLAYRIYFYVYWTEYALDAALSLIVIYGIFRLAMEPLKGLQTLGSLVFKWAGAISIAVAAGVALTPHQSGLRVMLGMATQFQRTSSILTLCLLLFVCFAIRPMGLSFKSRIFGVSLGLGFQASFSLVAAAWVSHVPSVFSLVSSLTQVAGLVTLLIWSAYFTFPEPKRRIIVLPTTSPFLRWNQISEVLGDEPGYVAIAGVPPEIFAPAEIEIMRRASIMMDSGPPPETLSPAALKSLSA